MQPTPRFTSVGRAAVWIVVSAAAFVASQYIVAFGYKAALLVGVVWEVNSPASLLTFRLLVYVVMAALLALAIWYRCRKVSLSDISLTRLPTWKDIGLTVPGAVIYTILTVSALTIAATFFGMNAAQAQDLGFSHAAGGELLAAFIVLVVLTPVFEEALFRGFLYGRLRRTQLPWWIPAVIVSILFGLAHGQWNVGIDVFFLSMVACALREITGSIWAGILLHIAKNMLAFLVTFVFVSGVAG